MSERDGTDFLAGAVIEGWYAKNLRGDKDGLGRWSEADIVTFLRTGSTDRTAAFGNMADVVEHGTQYLTDGDLSAIARYLKSLPARAAEPVVAGGTPSGSSSAPDKSGGASATYEEYCVTCHRTDGSGVTRIFPALAGNDVVDTANATSLVHVVLSGGRRPRSAVRPNAYAMPAFTTLDDSEVAAVVTYIANRLGQRGRSRYRQASGRTPELAFPSGRKLPLCSVSRNLPERLSWLRRTLPIFQMTPMANRSCWAGACWPTPKSCCPTMSAMR